MTSRGDPRPLRLFESSAAEPDAPHLAGARRLAGALTRTEPRQARGWFSGLARVFSSQPHTAREPERAPDPATNAPAPRTDERELALHRVLVEELLALEEPLRATIVRRFHHGLSAAEIAREDATPESTVRAREHRAIELLRERLDRRHGGKRGAWIALFLPFARSVPPHEWPTSVAPNTKAPLGALTSAGALAVAGLVAVVGAFVALSGRSSSIEAGARIAAAADGTRKHAGPISTADSADAARAPADARASFTHAATTFTVVGRTVDDLGTVLAGVELAPDAEDTDFTPRPPAVSAADGRFECVLTSDRPPGGWHGPELPRYVQLRARRANFAPALLKVVVPPGQPVEIGDVVLPRSGGLRGRVVDAARRPVAGVECLVTAPDLEPAERAAWPRCEPRAKREFERATTDDDGRFEFAALPAGHVRVFARRRGWEPVASATLEVAQGAWVDAGELATEPQPGWIEGRVVDEDGAPVARALVVFAACGARSPGAGDAPSALADASSADDADPHAAPKLVTADEDGRFAARVGGPCDLVTLGTGRAPAEGALAAVAPDAAPVVLVARRSISAALAVRAARGPVDGWVSAEWLLPNGQRIAPWAGKVRDARIPLPRLPFATRLLLHAERYATAELDVPGDLAPGARLEHVLADVSVLTGRVVDVAGAPVVGASILLVYPTAEPVAGAPEAFRMRLDTPNRIVISGADGGFVVARERPLPYVFVAHDRELRRSETRLHQPGEPAESQPFELVLGPFERIVGRVLVGPNDRAETKRVVATSGDGLTRECRPLADGTFALEGLNAGRWRAWVDELPEDEVRTVFPPEAHQDVLLEAGRPAELVFDLRGAAPCTVEGRIVLEGVPTRAWTLFWHRLGPDAAGAFQAPVAEDGRFRARVASARSTWFRAVDDGLGVAARCVTWRAELEPGDRTARIDVPTGALDVGFAAGAGREVAHAWRGADELEVVTRVRLDARGRAEGVRVPAGRGRILAVNTHGELGAELAPPIELARGGRVQVVIDARR
ncbi:MAG: carboxypeptidase regulatory-like domain-containing protein [Planctomycetes bacterium]|nr:carboxypeptidase regulatory-like domain-containing protein [Planctomycetota bacterium]